MLQQRRKGIDMESIKNTAVIAAVRSEEEFLSALGSQAKIIFDLKPNIMTLADRVKMSHSYGKKIFIHIDLADGVGKDRSGVRYVKEKGADGVISTKSNIIKFAREVEMANVQRFFAVDSKSVETILETVKLSKPDMVEVMPGVAFSAIQTLSDNTSLPVIAGGLVECESDIEKAAECGASAISTTKAELWNL